MKLLLLLLLIPSLSFGAVKAVTGDYEKQDTVVINRNFRELQQGQTITKLQSMFRYKVGTFTSASGTGNQSITGIGFKPRLIILTFCNGTSTSSGFVEFSLGFGTETEQVSAVTGFAQGDPPFGNGLSPSTTTIIRGVASTTPFLSGSLTSLDSDGFTINWTIANTQLISYIAFE